MSDATRAAAATAGWGLRTYRGTAAVAVWPAGRASGRNPAILLARG